MTKVPGRSNEIRLKSGWREIKHPKSQKRNLREESRNTNEEMKSRYTKTEKKDKNSQREME